MSKFAIDLTLNEDELCCLIQALTHESAEVSKELSSDDFDYEEGYDMYESLCEYKESCDELTDRLVEMSDELFNAGEHKDNVISLNSVLADMQ